MVHIANALEPFQNRQMWMWFQFSKQLPKKFTVGAQYQLRLGSDISNLPAHNFYGVVGYRINPYLSTQFTYQFFTSRKSDNHTFFVSITARYRYKNFTFRYRSAYQRVHEYFAQRYERGHEPVNEWRNRVSIQYRINPQFDVFIFCEPYLNFNPKANAKGLYVNKIRNLIGVDWHFYRYNTLGVFYIFQPEFFSKRPQLQHVIGTVYEFDLPKKVKWKKFFHPYKDKKKEKDAEREDKERPFF
ncbi:MAG: DUF2490 domain-containing protein [Chitinophagales bacterium]|nr:DUF2490 domain-containing protein [Chitinophagales bacterium]